MRGLDGALHSQQGTNRHGRPREFYDALEDYGSHEASKARDKSRRQEPHLETFSAVGPCSLCEPGYVCAFHRDEASSA